MLVMLISKASRNLMFRCFMFSIVLGYCSVKMTQKENVSNLLRLRILRYWGKPYALKRVNAHAIRREPSTSVLVHILQIPQLSEYKNQSGRFNVYVIQLLLCYHTQYSFIGSTIIYCCSHCFQLVSAIYLLICSRSVASSFVTTSQTTRLSIWKYSCTM